MPNVHGEPCGPLARGENALYRWYETRGPSWVFVAAGPDLKERARIVAALEASELPGLKGSGLSASLLDDAALTRVLSLALSQTEPAAAVQMLRKAGAVAQPLNTMESLRKSNINTASRFPLGHGGASTFLFREEVDHPIGSTVTMFAPCGIRTMNPSAVVCAPSPQPKLGEHTREVLCKVLSYSEAEFDHLLGKSVVAEERSPLYIPEGNPWGNDTDAFLERMVSKL